MPRGTRWTNEWTGLTEPPDRPGRPRGPRRARLGPAGDRPGPVTAGGPPCGSASTRGSRRAGMTDRAACLRRPPRAPDVALGVTARLGFCQFCRFLAGLMIGGHTLVFNAARKALPTVLTGPLP